MSYWTRHICEVHGHIIEGRLGWLGAEHILVDGKLVSSDLFAAMRRAGHFFELVDEQGRTRNAEVHFKATRLGLKYVMVVSIDGVQRTIVRPATEAANLRRVCRYCGYSLGGLEPENKEYRCPECGRHTPAIEVGAEVTAR
jgi:Zn finger protein HypA/HybF involved in hydrogenase expression